MPHWFATAPGGGTGVSGGNNDGLAAQKGDLVLFHVSALALPAGTVLRPYAIAHDHRDLIWQAVRAIDEGPHAVTALLGGTAWNRLVSDEEFRAGMVLLEAAFERVRRRIAPALPSRLGVVFAWSTLADAVGYRDVYQPAGIIHSCILVAGRRVERDGTLVVGAFETANLAQPRATDLPRAEEHAVRYWGGQAPMAHPEVLVEGTVVVADIVVAP